MYQQSLYAKGLKRAFDVTLAVFLLIFLAPVFLLLYGVCWRTFGCPVFFRQLRPGQNGKAFCLIKFRTMTNKMDAGGKLLPDEQRLTRFGKFLRSSSLDELPELLNIVRGEMSFVGPRPLLMEYLPRYSNEQARRHEVKPGLTGWAQINGRNAIPWNEKFKLDVWYVDNLSVTLDVKIIWRTFWKIVQREGISHNDSETMPVFRGNEMESD
jgi:sugar transferase EpsL